MDHSKQKRPLISRSGPVPPVSSDPSRVIARALFDARGRGLDDVSQSRFAVAAVLTVRPDMSAQDAAQSVEWVRRQDGISLLGRRPTDLNN